MIWNLVWFKSRALVDSETVFRPGMAKVSDSREEV